MFCITFFSIKKRKKKRKHIRDIEKLLEKITLKTWEIHSKKKFKSNKNENE